MKMEQGLAVKCLIHFTAHPDSILTTQDIAKRYQTTSVAVRHALAVMKREGLLETRGTTAGQIRVLRWAAGPELLRLRGA
jgi:DNA-binding IscR family transcriptional regulator